MPDQTPIPKPESAEQPSREGLSSSALFSVCFHARPTFGPAEDAEIVVPIKTALELERQLAEEKSFVATMEENRQLDSEHANQLVERLSNTRQALRDMLDMWHRACEPRNIELDSQVIAAREALSSENALDLPPDGGATPHAE